MQEPDSAEFWADVAQRTRQTEECMTTLRGLPWATAFKVSADEGAWVAQ